MFKDKKILMWFFLLGLLSLPTQAKINEENIYDALIVFGDSLSDVGSYNVGPIAALGGGKFSINSPLLRIWPERLAEELGLEAPCPAITGFNGATLGIVPVAHHAGCFAYAQGGSRVTNEIGIGNPAAASPGSPAGALTVPVVAQIMHHLDREQSFGDKNLVAVWAGSNDILANILSINALENIIQASNELVAHIKNHIIGHGAKRIIVLNIGDIRHTPLGVKLPLSFQTKINDMIVAFNNRLVSGLADVSDTVLLLDIYSEGQLWAQNPAAYGISNTTSTACYLDLLPYPSALLCTASTLVAEDTSGYFFADLVHPAPKGHQVIADFVQRKLKEHGWLAK